MGHQHDQLSNETEQNYSVANQKSPIVQLMMAFQIARAFRHMKKILHQPHKAQENA
jgi:hypothetical protein